MCDEEYSDQSVLVGAYPGESREDSIGLLNELVGLVH